MKILQLKTSAARGGAETMLLQLTAGLSARGHAVTTVLGEPGWLGERLRASGYDVDVMRLGGTTGVLRIAELAGLVRRLDADVILSHGARVNLVGALAGARAGTPSVAVEHSCDHWRRRGHPLDLIDRFVAKKNRGRIAVSKAVGRLLVERGILPADRVAVIPNGVRFPARDGAPDPERTRRRFGLETSHEVLVTVARLAPPKGHRDLLAAVAKLAPRRPRMRCLLLGDGPLRPQLETQARGLGIADIVTFAGAVDDVLAILPACDLFVLPSLWEGLPVAVVEAMGMGLPVIATRVAGTPEVVHDGETGRLVPPADPDTLAAAIEALLDDADLRLRIAGAARAFARGSFAFDAALDRYEEVLRRWSKA